MAHEYARFWDALAVDAGSITNKAVLMALCVHINRETGNCYVGALKLAEELCCEERCIRRALDSLETMKLIKVERRKGRTPVITLTLPANPGLKARTTETTPDSKPGPPRTQSPDRRTASLNSHNEQQQQREPRIAAAVFKKWTKPDIGPEAARWLTGQCQYNQAMGHAFQNGTADADKAALVLKLGSVDGPGIERALKLAPGDIVLPCSILATYDTIRSGSRIKNPGGLTVKRLRELVAECKE